MSCSVRCRRSSDLALLWLWCRPAATAMIRPLAWEPPYATGSALKKKRYKGIVCVRVWQKKTKDKKIKINCLNALFNGKYWSLGKKDHTPSWCSRKKSEMAARGVPWRTWVLRTWHCHSVPQVIPLAQELPHAMGTATKKKKKKKEEKPTAAVLGRAFEPEERKELDVPDWGHSINWRYRGFKLEGTVCRQVWLGWRGARI